jgi:hypothetical protein
VCAITADVQARRLVVVGGKEDTMLVLPMRSKRDVYKYYIEGVKDGSCLNAIGYTSFQNMWNTEFPQLKLSLGNKSDFSRCAECSYYCERIGSCRGDLRNEYRARLAAHHQHQSDQRAVYYAKRLEAHQNGRGVLSIIIDAMVSTAVFFVLRTTQLITRDLPQDQSKTDLPILKRESKAVPPIRLKQKLMGVMVHGVGTYLYVTSPPVKCDTNFNIECLVRTLHKVAAERRGLGWPALPPVLYLQLGE